MLLAIKNDLEFNELFKDATISQGGNFPHIQPELLPIRTPSFGKKKNKKKAQLEAQQEVEEDEASE